LPKSGVADPRQAGKTAELFIGRILGLHDLFYIQAGDSATPSQTPIPATETATMTATITALTETAQPQTETRSTTIITPGFCLGLVLIAAGGCLIWCLINLSRGKHRKNPYRNQRFRR